MTGFGKASKNKSFSVCLNNVNLIRYEQYALCEPRYTAFPPFYKTLLISSLKRHTYFWDD